MGRQTLLAHVSHLRDPRQGIADADGAAGEKSERNGSIRSHNEKPVPCTHYAAGNCERGDACPYSHAYMDYEAKPLNKKRAAMCTYFEQGKCMRGAACTFAHGRDELTLIAAL